MKSKGLTKVSLLWQVFYIIWMFLFLFYTQTTAQLSYDYGDAPDTPYPTLHNNNGAYHTIDPKVYLGNLVDPETDGQPTSNATGDDKDGTDDEDGVSFPSPILAGKSAEVAVTASVPGKLNAWIDFNKDGDWDDAGEHIFNDTNLSPGTSTLNFNVPSSAFIGFTFSRFRFSVLGGLSSTGPASNGEVEDYRVEIEKDTPEVTYDWGDAPLPYPTLRSDNGARHSVNPGYYLGAKIDSDNDGKPDENAAGDDNDGNDDEDGVVIKGSLIKGDTAYANVTASAAGILNAWFDFNRDGDWDDPGERFANFQTTPGLNVLPIIVPENADPGTTYARFRYSDTIFDRYDGPVEIGEVEDLVVEVFDRLDFPYEYGDAPEGIMAYPDIGVIGSFPTLKDDGPAGFIRHGTRGEMYLGYEVDYETDGNTGSAAPTGDPWDTDEGLNDRRADVVIYTDLGLTDPCNYTIRGDAGSEYYWPYSVTGGRGVMGQPGESISWGDDRFDVVYHVTAEDGAYLNVLIDWNRDGSWGGVFDWDNGLTSFHTPEHIIQNFHIPHGEGLTGYGRLSDLDPDVFVLPEDVTGYLWSRWTITDEPIEGEWDGSGIFSDGETEDCLLAISLDGFFEFGDAPQQALAYPDAGTIGRFGTDNHLEPGGAIKHNPVGQRYFGDCVDYEWCGNAGMSYITPWVYDADETFNNELIISGLRDAGLRNLIPYTIIGSPGWESVWPFIPEGEEGELNRSLGSAEQTIVWGENLDFYIAIKRDAGDSYFNAVFDWDQDGIWHTREYTVQNFLIPASETPFYGMLSELDPPPFEIGSNPGYVWARFSITSMPTPEPWVGHGSYLDGESEDYLLHVSDFRYYFDFGDIPFASYGTFHGNNGALHTVMRGFFLGDTVDTDPDGQPKAGGFGDDYDGSDDDDGVYFPAPLIPGQTAVVKIKASAAGILSGWIDFNRNSTWNVPDEQIFIDRQLTSGMNELTFPVPASAALGVTFARFRFSDTGGLAPNGPPHFTELPQQDKMPPVGEVEDYSVLIIADGANFDFGDAPDPAYPTLYANSGAFHAIDPKLYLGSLIDAETDGLPNPDAKGDDSNGVNDDDGVKFDVPLILGKTASLTIIASDNGYINAWIDFNGDGDWTDPGEQIFLDKLIHGGNNDLSFNVPDTITIVEKLCARFRFNSTGGLYFAGPAADGEVEDYIIPAQPLAVEGNPDLVTPPQSFALYQNYPNPFNPETNIRFEVKTACFVTLKVYDLLGRELYTLVQSRHEPGRYNVKFDASKLASGIYFYSITMGDFKATRKMAVLK
ncbi:T9SS type A sorting domain-containing protein [candidate division KSB1 bacterium]|nr:T9SS type A sorting domain-containing protein [candidate division KSB1 bacterium]